MGRSAFSGLADASGVRAHGDEVRADGRRCGGLRRFAGDFCVAGHVDWDFAVHRGVGCSGGLGIRIGGTAMSGSRRLLIIGGVALAIWGMSYGLWYAVFAEHQA